MRQKADQKTGEMNVKAKKQSVFNIPNARQSKKEQLQLIVDFSTDLYEYICAWWELRGVSETMTSAFATFISRNFHFADFTSEEIKQVLYRVADALRKDKRKGR